ncbi:hypothetical protein PROFUN_05137 [Planoprotostelium fungivorum]|uniref:Uncharacterized protein n=1 Tax=Planoprotostelium fungivorum TaxID=1890364 RepID=A0A2P6NS11_9EUKA|nr:hypothetical protein PROFUN_05137 [Planoprotostelium fungivorum]
MQTPLEVTNLVARTGKRSIVIPPVKDGIDVGVYQHVDATKLVGTRDLTFSAWNTEESSVGASIFIQTTTKEGIRTEHEFKLNDREKKDGEIGSVGHHKWHHHCFILKSTTDIHSITVFLSPNADGPSTWDDIDVFPEVIDTLYGNACDTSKATPKVNTLNHVLPHALVPDVDEVKGDLCVSTFMKATEDDLKSIQQMVETWKGEVSVAVTIQNPAEDIPLLEHFSEFLLPYNFLRNVAADHCRAEWVVHLQLGSIFGRGSLDTLRALNVTLSKLSDTTSALVVPELQLATTDKEEGEGETRRKSERREIDFPLSQRDIDPVRWAEALAPYVIHEFSKRFTPTVITKRKGSPRWDESYAWDDPSGDRAARALELYLAGYKLIVLPHVWLVCNEPETKPQSPRTIRDFYDFSESKSKLYNRQPPRRVVDGEVKAGVDGAGEEISDFGIYLMVGGVFLLWGLFTAVMRTSAFASKTTLLPWNVRETDAVQLGTAKSISV